MTFLKVACRPCCATDSRTVFTWSGRARALPSSDSLASRDLHHLGARGDERELGADEHATRPRRRAPGRRAGSARRTCSSERSASSVATLLAEPLLEREQLPDLLGPVGGAARSSSMMPTRLPTSPAHHPSGRRSSTISARSRRTQARSGALNSPLGRFTISLGRPARPPASGTPCARGRRSWRCPDGERRLGHLDVHERDAHLGRCRHARPVGVGEVEAGQEQLQIGHAHAVDRVVDRPWNGRCRRARRRAGRSTAQIGVEHSRSSAGS